MKRTVLVFLLVGLALVAGLLMINRVLSGGVQADQRAVSAANALVESGHTAEAVQIYEQLVEQGARAKASRRGSRLTARMTTANDNDVKPLHGPVNTTKLTCGQEMESEGAVSRETIAHFPMQKSRKTISRSSSISTRPVMRPIERRARRRSSAISSGLSCGAVMARARAASAS